jgi:CheY-like chemotaxis protein
MGIPRDMLPRIFDTFMQVDRSLERAQGGLGIGLSLVRALVDMHEGTVEARSEGHGKGSEFIVRLSDAVASEPRDVPSGRSEFHTASSSYRILVVDDNRDSALSLAMMLKIMGHDTRTAHDGEAAVEMAESFRPDVVLLDIGLPKMNGYDACRQIRAASWGERMVLIALTGWGQDEDKLHSKEAGFNFHMIKPVDPEALAKILSGLLLTPA